MTNSFERQAGWSQPYDHLRAQSGLVLRKVGEPKIAVLEAVMTAMCKITRWTTSFAPIAIFAIWAWLFATQGLATMVALATLVGVMYLGLAIMIVIFWLMLLAIG
jgi:dicarboxylate/amino acid:cation (Na+ or H+) symporter, DAACS family